MSTQPSDTELIDAYDSAPAHGNAQNVHVAGLRAVLAKWGTPATGGEPVYAFRRKGLDDFCTCDKGRYEELSDKPNLFETRIFYTSPQPVRESLTDEEIADFVGDEYHHMTESELRWFRLGEAAHGITGGQHGKP